MKKDKQLSVVPPAALDMQIVVQLLDSKSGQRTRPVKQTRRAFADALADLYVASHSEKTYVLILADDSGSPGNLDFALAPLMTVETFIKHFSTKGDLVDDGHSVHRLP